MRGKVVAIIQARMNSTRLPGKMLMRLGQKTVIEQVISQVSCSRRIDQIVVATTIDPSDDCLAESAEDRDIVVFRGNPTDVLERYYHCACQHKADVIVRITGGQFAAPVISKS